MPCLGNVFPDCIRSFVCPSGTEGNMQSPFQKDQAPTKNKETKIKSLIKMGISKIMETLLHKKHHLFTSKSAARTAVLPQTLTFWLAYTWAQKGMLMVCWSGYTERKELLQEAQKIFSVVQVGKGSGIMALQWTGMFLSYSLAFNDVKGQKVLTDTQQTPERLIIQQVSSPSSAPPEHLKRVFKFNLQIVIVFLCSTGLFLFRASACTFHSCNAGSHNGQ